MKLTKEEFKQYIISEVTRIGLAEGWLTTDSNSEQIEIPVIQESKETTTVQEPSKTQNEIALISESTEKLDKILKNDLDTAAPAVDTTTPLEVKKLNEEFKRMKQLVDFRSPLLIKD